jgi:hypothetical protein
VAGASDGGAPGAANHRGLSTGSRGAPAADESAPPTNDDEESTFRKPSPFAAPTPLVVPLTNLGVASLASDDDEADPTKVVGQPPMAVAMAVAATADAPRREGRTPPGDNDTSSTTLERSAKAAADDTYEADESVTRIAPPVDLGDDSVTTDRPVARPHAVPAGGDTESVTKRKEDSTRPPRGTSASVDDDSGGRETAVMVTPHPPPAIRVDVTAPLYPAPRPVLHVMRGGAAVAEARAELPDSVTESVVSVTLEPLPATERVNMEALLASGARLHRELSPGPIPTFDAPFETHAEPGPGFERLASGTVERRNYPTTRSSPLVRYDALVVVVALVSFAVPFGLFIYLYGLLDHGSNEPPRAAEVAADPVSREDPLRTKALKAAPSATDSHERRLPPKWPPGN